MKISKLFHWLYAILMFLPIMVFIPNAFYYGFNEQAVAQEKTEQVPSYYQTNEVYNINSLQLDYGYKWNNDFTPVSQQYTYALFGIYNTDNLSILNIPRSATSLSFNLSNEGIIRIRYSYNNGTYYKDITHETFSFVIKTFASDFSHTSDIISHISATDELIPNGLTQPLTTTMSITDSMSYAWDSVWQNDLFSWTNNTFLKQPFVYITDLFSIPSDNVLINALSYWLDISIIWLVFDVIMYVPLLVHRWLDKGIIE